MYTYTLHIMQHMYKASGSCIKHSSWIGSCLSAVAWVKKFCISGHETHNPIVIVIPPTKMKTHKDITTEWGCYNIKHKYTHACTHSRSLIYINLP